LAKTHEVHVQLKDGLHFEAETGEEGFSIPLDADENVGGQGLGMRPAKMVLVGLAGCSAMDVLSILRKKRQAVTDMRVNVRAGRAEDHPKVYTRIELEFVVTGHGVDPAAVERSIELSMTKYCPVAAMLSQTVPIETGYRIIEAEPSD
jgi:putative redox protein